MKKNILALLLLILFSSAYAIDFTLFDEVIQNKLDTYSITLQNKTDNSTQTFTNFRSYNSSSTQNGATITNNQSLADFDYSSATEIDSTLNVGESTETATLITNAKLGSGTQTLNVSFSKFQALLAGGAELRTYNSTLTGSLYNFSSDSWVILGSKNISGSASTGTISDTSDFQFEYIFSSDYLNSTGWSWIRLQNSFIAPNASQILYQTDIKEIFPSVNPKKAVFRTDKIGNIGLFISNDDYTQRIYYYTLTNSTTDQNIYLLQTTDSTAYAYNIQELGTQLPIENALLTVTKYIPTESAQVTVSQFLSNVDGSTALNLKLGDPYRITITEPEHSSLAFNFVADAIQTKTVALTTSGTPSNLIDSTIWTNISWSLTPTNTTFNSSFPINFSIVDSDATLEIFGMEVYYTNTSNYSQGKSLVSNDSVNTSASGGVINYTATNKGIYDVIPYFKKTNNSLFTFDQTRYWLTNSTGIPFVNFQEAFSDTTYWIFALISTVAVVVMFSRFSDNGFAIAIVGFLVLTLFVFMNPNSQISGVPAYSMLILTGLMLAGYGFMELK